MYMPLNDIHGFSLIELLIVVAISAMLVAFAVPSMYATFPTWEVNGAVRRISADMQYVRVRAISRNNDHWMFFDGSTSPISYSIYEDDGDGVFTVADETLVKTVGLSTLIQYGMGSITAGPAKGDGSDVPEDVGDGISFTNNAVLFKNAGSTNEDGGVYLIPVDDVASGRNNRLRAVAVRYETTANTKSYRHNGTVWAEF